MTAYYNENDPYAAAWLRNLISENLIAPGEVDERSIVDVRPGDIADFTQCHFFAGIGGWSYAARLAGWPDNKPLWTGSCPCQPFSVAGAGKGQADARHLWPEFYRLIAACRPAVVMGEQVAAAVGKSWLDGVCSDLEGIGYACGAAVVPACAVDAPHRRDRLWFVADRQDRKRRIAGKLGTPEGDRISEISGERTRFSVPECGGRSLLAHADNARLSQRIGDGRIQRETLVASTRQAIERDGLADADQCGPRSRIDDQTAGHRHPVASNDWSSPWAESALAIGADGKARRVKPGIRLLAHGIPARVGKLRAFGNAIVPQVAAEIIGAYLDVEGSLT